MVQQITIGLSHGELSALINDAVKNAINERLAPNTGDELLTQTEAANYIKASKSFIWKLATAGKITCVNAGKKTLYPKSSIDKFLGLKSKKPAVTA